jgi:hypothetical protein
MRFLAFALSGFLLIVCSCPASTDFSGTWDLDLKASTSPDSLLKRLEIPPIQRRFAARMKIKAVYQQSPDQLVIIARASGFSRTERLHFSGPPESRKEEMTGTYTIQTHWSAGGTQLISTYKFRLKDGKNASLLIKRELTDAGTTLVLNQTMRVEGEPQSWDVQRIWHKGAK